jgi:hypothetical protein
MWMMFQIAKPQEQRKSASGWGVQKLPPGRIDRPKSAQPISWYYDSSESWHRPLPIFQAASTYLSAIQLAANAFFSKI